jgi:hypothetical protein
MVSPVIALLIIKTNVVCEISIFDAVGFEAGLGCIL